MENFSQLKASGSAWISEPFYSGPGGYKICLVAGYDDSKGGHVSVSVKILEGENDYKLRWPLHGEITIQLLNWRENNEENNYEEMILDYKIRPTCGVVNVTCGWPAFVSHSDLIYNPHKNTEYLRNDMLLFKIVSVTIRKTT